MRVLHYRSFLLIIIFILFSPSAATRDSLNPLQPLYANETLISLDGHFALGFFNPSNSQNRYIGMWYYKIKVQTVVWVANRQNPLTNSTGTLSITANGTLRITNQDSIVVWSTITTGLTAPVAQLLNNGNFVVRQDGESSGASWQGFDYPTDTLLPGMKLGISLTTGFRYTLTAWKSNHDPSPGEYFLAMDVNGNPQMFLYAGPYTEWRSGPWAGVQFNGNPDTIYSKEFSFTYVNNKEEVMYSYSMQGQSTVSRLVDSPSGVLQRFIWLEDILQWNLVWIVPQDRCDRYGECGPYGACDPNNSTICSCLPGFMAKDSVQQAYKDETVGCTRKTELDCLGGTDGFVALHGVKLPDTTNCTVDLSLSLEGCRTMCLRNCSCTAYACADVRDGGSGCVIWLTELSDIRLQSDLGQDLYVRVSAANIGLLSGHSHKKKMIVAIVVSSISVIFLLVCGCCFLWKIKKRTGVAPGHSHKTGMAVVNMMKLLSVTLVLACVGLFQWKRKKRRGDATLFNDQSSNKAEKNDLDLPLFGFGTIAVATDYFSAGNKLGEGGFGPVYKGKLGESQEIAVKRLAKTSQQGTDEFKNEVMLIAKLQHRNLVRLFGYCIQGEERMLIYEYMPNKSLDAFLFDKEKGALLNWKTRYQIIIGITRGCLYLHHDSRFRIIHRDLKASNILLDQEMNPKISDFGMARIFGGDETDFNTRKVVGTYGYMSPEYAMTGIFSMKSDVFSFGVLVLEIISGRRNRGAYSFPPHLNLVAHVWSLWNEGKSLQIVHESMNDSFPPEEVLKCVKVGLLCVQERPEDRPLMSSVVVMLGSASDIASLPHPNQPGFIAFTGPPETHPPPSKKQESCTSNDLTVSLDGR